MGSIVFAAPGVDQFHLHERLRRELQQHGHSVDVLSLDPAAHTFWRHQGGATTLLEPRSPDAMRAPLGDLADRECTRRGLGGETSARRRHRSAIERRLARLLPTLATWIETHRPGLVLLHEQRSAEHALVHWAARELGCPVLWTGDGLLPHTLQADERGLDGDAAASQRRPGDYRVVDGDPALLQACLSNVLARTIPAALTRREVVVPSMWARLGCVWAATAARGAGGARSALFGWRRALPPRANAHRAPLQLPRAPFVTVLLQDEGQARVTMDAVAPPTAGELIRASIAAAARLDAQLHVVVVLPRRALRRREFVGLCATEQLHFVHAEAAPEAAALAVATITINHPLASLALLAGTPVLHVGRALYGLRGVTTHVATAELAEALPEALAEDHTALRQRFLTWLFGYGHLWCSATHPDHNGLAGFVQAIEARLAQRHPGGSLPRYRRGPAWPLAAEPHGS